MARMKPPWAVVDDYLVSRLVTRDPVLDGVLEASASAGLPPHHVTPNKGKLLQLLAQAQGAHSVLEIGTLGGYSTIWLARALPPGGRLVTIEADARHGEVAEANIRRAGLADVVDVVVGPALDALSALHTRGAGPFDFVFIDADKPNNPHYLTWALKLSRVGTLIVADNVVRDGAVTDPASADPNVTGIREFIELLGSDQRITASAIQTVGSKGYDGFAIALVIA